MQAIRAFPSGKAAGPDGFGCEFSKVFHERIVPVMLRMVNDSVKDKWLPWSLYEANIQVESVVNVYADDLLICISDPVESVELH